MRIYTRTELKQRRRQLRKRQTPAEDFLWQHLRGNKLGGFKFRRQHSIGSYIVDFYCAPVKLAIEIDGSIHRRKDVRENDVQKTAYLDSLRIRVIRFSNHEVLDNVEGVKNSLLRALCSIA
jgi:very-short-patch-repair endonuclease